MKKKDRYFYPAIFNYDDNEIAVSFPDLDVSTSGVDEQDALLSARELLGCVIFGLEEDKENLPNPSKLYDVKYGKNERAVLIDVYMPSVRLSQENKSVNRTVTLPYWLNSKALEYDVNFSQLLQEALKKQLGIDKIIK